jgi:K+-sensing histidine kinase KdpD
MHNQTEKLKALLETTKAITLERDLNKVLKLILQRGKELTHADTGALLLVDKDQKLWTEILIGPHQEDEYRHTIDEGITGWVARNKEPLLVPDVRSDERYIEWTHETKSELAVPMLYGNKLIGVLNVESFKGDAFEKSDCELLAALAGHAAIAIENARRFEIIQKANEELSANVMAWLGIVGSTWQHEIIQGIFAIETGIAILESYLPATYPDEIKATLEAINKDIQETKGVQPDFPHDDVMRSVNLNSVIETSVKKLTNRIEDKGIKIRLDLDEEIPSVKASHAWLEVVFNILIDNAIRAMADEGKLTFSSKVEEDGVKVEITDTGTGIPENIQKQLFKKRIGGARGFGVGLLLAKIILRRYRGDIKLSSTGPGGTTFALILPVETKTR